MKDASRGRLAASGSARRSSGRSSSSSATAILAYAEQTAPSGVSALFLATIPLYVPLLAWWLAGDRRPSLRLTATLIAGFAGVALLVVAQGSGGVTGREAALLLFSAFCWAAGTVATRLVPVPRSPLLGAATPLLAGGVLLVLVALAHGGAPGHLSPRSAIALAYLILIGTVATFSAYIWLLRVVNPNRVATYAFVNPRSPSSSAGRSRGRRSAPGRSSRRRSSSPRLPSRCSSGGTGGAERPRPARRA